VRSASLLFCSLLLVAAGCSPPPPTQSAESLSNTFASPDELARAVLDRFAQNDLSALRLLAITEREFRRFVWPHLPASRPERNVPVEYAWGQLQQRSEEKLAVLLSKHGARPYVLQGIEFAGGTSDYGRFQVRRDSRVRVLDADGRPHELSLFGSVLVADGRFKVFSFVVDD
jgi:hypothetical protein